MSYYKTFNQELGVLNMNNGINLLAALSAGLILAGKKGGSFGRRSRQWTEEEISLLGTMSDIDLSKIIGMAPSGIHRKRRELGIPRYSPFNDPKNVALIGTMRDYDLAIQLGMSEAYVSNKRRELGLPTFNSNRIDWTPDKISLLGTMSDPELARIIGTNKTAVRLKRVELGIPSYELISDQDSINLLGQMSDRDVAEILGCAPALVGAKRRRLGIPAYSDEGIYGHLFTDEIISMIGVVPDAEIANMIGVHRSVVNSRRISMGIESPRTANRSRPTAQTWTPENLALLGTMPDGDLARRLGLTNQAVRYMRQKHGIERFN